jgi:putative transposase
MEAVAGLAREVGVEGACAALGVPRATWYRRQQPEKPPRPRKKSPRALSASERAMVLSVLSEDRFVDRAPEEVYATLLDESVYYCSWRTMYRILEDNKAVRERRNQRRHPEYKKPELVARAPNEVWSWDITKLRGPTKGTYYYLFVVMDIFSRKVVGWMLADRENANLAGVLIAEACSRHGITPDSLILHSDRGAPMTAKCTAQLLADLGVTRSLSRPRVSDDNPFSEAQFKTLKYGPGFPDRFGSFEDARAFCREFFRWYNNDHRHSGIAMLTPLTVHEDRADEVLARRQAALDAAHAAHPERFPRGTPKARPLPEAVWINPPPPVDAAVPDVEQALADSKHATPQPEARA